MSKSIIQENSFVHRIDGLQSLTSSLPFDSLLYPCYISIVNIYQGISASSGIGIGHVYLINSDSISTPHLVITPEIKENEWKRFENARIEVFNYLNSLTNTDSDKQNEIFNTYCMMLSDPDFISQVKTAFFEGNSNIEYVLESITEQYADKLRISGNDYLMDRANDITDVYNRVLRKMLNIKTLTPEDIPENAVIISESLNPSDAFIFSQKKIAALVTQEGGTGSHLAIITRSYGIPFVFGIDEINFSQFDDNEVIVDGTNGRVYINPEPEILSEYKCKYKKEAERMEELASFITKTAETVDGTPITILANIGSSIEAEKALLEGASGIGLFRSEFLFLNDGDMSEERQFACYRQVLEIMGDKPVTIRTLDSGGDKLIKGTENSLTIEKNPLLGWRGIRVCLDKPQIFKTQLRALYKASIYGNLKIMIPMISAFEQLTSVKNIIKEVLDSLDQEGIPYKKNTPLGIMIETPAAAISADQFTSSCDFFSIGTNDLTQYTCCVDRENSAVSQLFSEFHPAVLHLIQTTTLNAKQSHIDLSVCGEFAGRLEGAVMLLGLGVRTLSVTPKMISPLKSLLAKISMTTINNTVQKALLLKTADEISEYIKSFINGCSK